MQDYDIFYNNFISLFDKEDKEGAVRMFLKEISAASTPEELCGAYREVLGKALNELSCSLKDARICFWKEHVKSGIVRTILESCYLKVLEIRDRNGIKHRGKAAVICPDGEYHDIGARMVADMFTLAGYDTVFVGASTPKEDFIYAVNVERPDIIALSVTNYYNLFSAKKTVAVIRAAANYPVKIVAGGTAFLSHPEYIKEIGADALMQGYEDIADGKEDK